MGGVSATGMWRYTMAETLTEKQMYRKEIAVGLAGNPEAVARIRVVLRQLLGGPVRLERGKKPGSLFAVFSLLRQALLEGRTSVVAGARFELYSAYPIRVPAVPASVIAAG